MIKAVIQSLATLVLISNIGILISFLLFLGRRTGLRNHYNAVAQFLGKNAYVLAFIVSLVATLGSLFLSEVAKFQPCILCWYQRIAMYPLPLLLYIAIIRGEKVITPYIISLSIAGAAIASYHYTIQHFPALEIAPCDANGISCTQGTMRYGFISIPYMALTAFLMIAAFMFLSRNIQKSHHSKTK